jgi:hypothetical protein
MSSRIRILSLWLQGLFTWIHDFKASSFGFMDSILKQSQGFFTWIHGFKASLLGFMDSRILQLDSWLKYSNNIPFHSHITIIIVISLSLLPHHHHHFHFDINDNIFSGGSSSMERTMQENNKIITWFHHM